MYYLVIVQNDTTQAISSYLTFEDALAAYHTELAYRSDDRLSTKCAVLDKDLSMLRCETYVKQLESSVETNDSN